MNIYGNITELIGSTPMMEFKNYEKNNKLSAKIIAKLEYFNPAGSVKDRVAASMLDDAERRGLLAPGAVIIEPTSGNTGIGLAAIGASRGYHVILTMPETMSIERRRLLAAYGAEIVLTDGAGGMFASIEKAKELAAKIPNSFIPSQFTNPANPMAHEKTTGVEIWNDTDGKVDIFVAGVGSGGTLSGCGRYLKRMNGDIKVVAIEPMGSPLLTGGVAGPHKIQGIGANFIPENLDRSVYDEVLDIPDDMAISTAAELAKTEGVLVGISSGAAVYGALLLAKRSENKGKTIVVLLPDTGERYLS